MEKTAGRVNNTYIYICIFTFSHLEFEVLVGQGSAV